MPCDSDHLVHSSIGIDVYQTFIVHLSIFNSFAATDAMGGHEGLSPLTAEYGRQEHIAGLSFSLKWLLHGNVTQENWEKINFDDNPRISVWVLYAR